MTKLTIDEQLSRLDSLDLCNSHDDDLEKLKKSLSVKNNRVVAKAAKLCAEHHLYQFCPNLKQAFPYFVDKPDKDKGCFAKKAIVKSLYELDFIDTDFYTLGIGIRQMEPVWGGSVDSAVDVRCWSAYGLTLSTNSRVILQILELLHDPEPQARLGAVKAIANTNPMHAEILLREKILDGDEEAYVIGECFHQLIAIEPDNSLEFLKGYLDHEQEEWVEYAALALAENKDTAAYEILKEAADRGFYDSRKKHLIVALTLHRSKQALDYLLGLLDSAGSQESTAIIDALSIYRGNDEVRQQLKAKVLAKDHKDTTDAFEQFWS